MSLEAYLEKPGVLNREFSEACELIRACHLKAENEDIKKFDPLIFLTIAEVLMSLLKGCSERKPEKFKKMARAARLSWGIPLTASRRNRKMVADTIAQKGVKCGAVVTRSESLADAFLYAATIASEGEIKALFELADKV